MTIHSTHPFADADRDASRQLRGRLGNRVTLWCAGELDGQPRAAGLTVGSTQLVPGDPWRVVAHVSEESDLLETIEKTGRATISLLGWPHRNLAEMFAGVAPAPGGPFRYGEFTQTGQRHRGIGVIRVHAMVMGTPAPESSTVHRADLHPGHRRPEWRDARVRQRAEVRPCLAHWPRPDQSHWDSRAGDPRARKLLPARGQVKRCISGEVHQWRGAPAARGTSGGGLRQGDPPTFR